MVKPSVSFEDDLRKLKASLMANNPPEDEPEVSHKKYKSIIRQAMLDAREKQKPKP